MSRLQEKLQDNIFVGYNVGTYYTFLIEKFEHYLIKNMDRLNNTNMASGTIYSVYEVWNKSS